MNDEPLPVRIASDGGTATWNPGLTRARQLWLMVRLVDGRLERRRTMNSGRARVRPGERIEAVMESGH